MSLTPEQVLRVASGNLLDGIDQHKLASLLGVNQGRVAEACGAIEYAMNNHMTIYKLATGKMVVMPLNGDPK